MGLNPRELLAVKGQIVLDGEDLLKKSSRAMRRLRGEKMAMIFQEPMTALNPVIKVGDQIREMLEIHSGASAAEQRARVLEVMADVNLPDHEKMYHSYPHQLSGGQRQRIMIAMALALEPGLLIADEPTTALDVTTQAQILELIKDIQRRHGMGVLFITHDFGVVAEIADRVVVMQHGRIVEQGTRDEIILAPQPSLHQDADRRGAVDDAWSPCRDRGRQAGSGGAWAEQGLWRRRLPAARARGACGQGRGSGRPPARDAGRRRRIGVGQSRPSRAASSG